MLNKFLIGRIMIFAKSISDIREFNQTLVGKSLGFVPTMGFLHEGHLSLVRKSKNENDFTAVSIFVNPTQFNQKEDFDNYPTNLEQDFQLLEKEGVDVVFMPTPTMMYSKSFASNVSIGDLSTHLEGSARPGHFDGVTTVVSKLFNIVEPTQAYFGQKDAQQALIIRRMVEELNFNLEMNICPTVREADGLAMSSRNSRLSSTQRENAPLVFQSLQLAEKMIKEGERKASSVVSEMEKLFDSIPEVKIDYISTNDATTLEDIEELKGEILISLAVFYDKVRLIDNTVIKIN
ncbi:MAG: pantoate--beta-alanine ligase [bacterium]|jgi:pantoate--beta-alanine ligase